LSAWSGVFVRGREIVQASRNEASKTSIVRTVDQPDPKICFYLFHGPDDAQSRGLGQRLTEALAASRFVISGSAVKSDPAILADEAGAMNLFGGTRVVWVEPAGDEIAAGVEALLEANASAHGGGCEAAAFDHGAGFGGLLAELSHGIHQRFGRGTGTFFGFDQHHEAHCGVSCIWLRAGCRANRDRQHPSSIYRTNGGRQNRQPRQLF